MTLDVLICTIDSGIARVPLVLAPPTEGVHYVVSMQYTSPDSLNLIPDVLTSRADVTLTTIEGRGLSLNRNNALAHSTADIRVIADDDNRYTPDDFTSITNAYREHAEADIICFAAESYEGKPMKRYPSSVMSFQQAFRQGYYPTSMEMTMRRNVKTLFDERFGLGSEHLCAGEEDVFMKDAQDQGYKAIFVPSVIVHSRFHTTGCDFLTSPLLQRTKGATFRHIFGTRNAVWRSIKEAAYHAVNNHANPFVILHNMIKGIWTLP
ncbi:MAG: glycosyltransferase [Bacteroidaceae bacterium]|nr:glycosyltransferase [Bacteroidaceae bacterium]